MSPDNPEEEVPELDPWGLGEVESLLSGLDGVSSLKIVPDGQGGIDEVHVVGTSELSPKQTVRNIESALLAEFGLQIDHRKISVAQVQEPDISAAAKEETSAPEEERKFLGTRWLLLDSLQIERKAGQKVACSVTLRNASETYSGRAEGPDFSQSRLDVAARAVLGALNAATLEEVSLRLEGVTRQESFGREMILVLVQGQERRRSVSLPGVSIISDSAEEAAVLACLQATNRWAGAT